MAYGMPRDHVDALYSYLEQFRSETNPINSAQQKLYYDVETLMLEIDTYRNTPS